MSFITAYCHISKDSCSVNGKPFLSNDKTSETEWTRQLYKTLQIDYPKFYKMDTLAKLAFIGSELIKQQFENINSENTVSPKTSPLSPWRGAGGEANDSIALIFSNRHSSADSDIKFNNSYTKESLPSPALFVYTLPNILIGEIAIRNQWFGENLFFVAEEFNATFFHQYAEIMMSKNSKACLCGWVDAVENKLEAFLFLVEPKDNAQLNLPFTSKILANLYKAKN